MSISPTERPPTARLRTRGAARTAAVALALLAAQGVPAVPQAAASPAAASPAAASPTAASSGSAKRPNIVLVVVDDWGYTDVGAFGGEIATPNLDALAAAGTRFASFHVSGECSPTRAMLLTGLSSHRAGVGAMRETVPWEHYGKPGYLTVLDRGVVTVATLLQQGGYRTYASGKWHVGKQPHNLPGARGFGRSLVQGDSGSDNWDPRQRYLALTDRVHWFEDDRPVEMPREYYSSEHFVDRALEWLRADAGRPEPFFLYLAFQANHIPLQAPREFIDRYRGAYDQGWEALREARRARAAALGLIPADAPPADASRVPDWDALDASARQDYARRMEVYAGMATAMDHHLGRLIDALRAAGEYDDTVFVFLSDNGAEPSDPYDLLAGRLWLATQYTRDEARLGGPGAYATIGPGWASAAVAPLATHKFYAGEGGLRVPMIVAGVPGQLAGTVHNGFTHVTDIAPTLLELAGVTHPANAGGGAASGVRAVAAPSGHSLLPVLRGEAARVRAPGETLGYELAGNAALFRDDLKLVRNQPPVGDGRWRLYDIARDPGETRDLAAERPADFAAMQADWERYARADGVRPMPEGYEPRRQVLLNALRFVYLPMLAWLLPALALVAGAWLFWRRRRRS